MMFLQWNSENLRHLHTPEKGHLNRRPRRCYHFLFCPSRVCLDFQTQINNQWERKMRRTMEIALSESLTTPERRIDVTREIIAEWTRRARDAKVTSRLLRLEPT